MTLSRPEPTLTGGDFQCRHCRLLAGSSPSLPDGSNPSAAIVQSASDVQCSRLLKTTRAQATGHVIETDFGALHLLAVRAIGAGALVDRADLAATGFLGGFNFRQV
ncbi:hypothetical protein [Burkholderia cenocepacia]|uniref:hypothetical protein n=1 Tax=Burkholderia cenocepacia TaxID=95486 RepID=UPI0015C551B6|nr:hypothetical protein [Burkholderia cenocepacia]